VTKIIQFPVKTAEQAEIEACQADEQLFAWMMEKLAEGLSAYALLGIIHLNAKYLSDLMLDEQEDVD